MRVEIDVPLRLRHQTGSPVDARSLQEDNCVLTATSLSQAITVASIEQLDVVLIAATEENTASYASTLKFIQPSCAILAVAADLYTARRLPTGVDAMVHVECIDNPIALGRMLNTLKEEADWVFNKEVNCRELLPCNLMC